MSKITLGMDDITGIYNMAFWDGDMHSTLKHARQECESHDWYLNRFMDFMSNKYSKHESKITLPNIKKLELNGKLQEPLIITEDMEIVITINEDETEIKLDIRGK